MPPIVKWAAEVILGEIKGKTDGGFVHLCESQIIGYTPYPVIAASIAAMPYGNTSVTRGIGG